MKKQLMIAATVATISLTGLGAAGIASAASDNNKSDRPTSLVDKLVTKFGLKKADVQAVFDEQHAARDEKRIQSIADKLAAGVKAGTITQDQSDKILAKVKELKTEHGENRDKMDNMTREERKAARETERSELKQWIQDNNIPDEFARLLHMGGHGMRSHGGNDNMAPTTENSPDN